MIYESEYIFKEDFILKSIYKEQEPRFTVVSLIQSYLY